MTENALIWHKQSKRDKLFLMKITMQPMKQGEKAPRDFALQTLTIPANPKQSTCTPNKQQGSTSII